jgi:hypothetical protein
MTKTSPWWARGLLFENCSCQAVCPGHVHFDQMCTYERCVGYWAIRFDDGMFDDVSLAGLTAVIIYDAPRHMIEGNWTEVFLIDRSASDEQRRAIETILSGSAGGPWAVLARFVSRRLETRYETIRIEDEGKKKHLVVGDLLEASLEAIRGRDREGVVTFENMFNQIHATSQVIAKGATRYDDGVLKVENESTHALYSSFDWSVS